MIDPLYRGRTESLSLKHLTAFLLALTRPSRSADLSQLDMARRKPKPDGVVFLPRALAKQSRQGKPIAEFFFPSFPNNKNLCPVNTLDQYTLRTKSLRGDETRLFVATIKPHKAVTSSSIARWMKSLLEASGVNIWCSLNPGSISIYSIEGWNNNK